MQTMIKIARVKILIIALLANASVVAADWRLDGEASSLQYLSSKLVRGNFAAIFESNVFAQVSGEIRDNQLVLVVNTASVNTKIPIRDTRVAEHVFQSGRYPIAIVTTAVDQKLLNEMAVGTVEVRDVQAKLTLRDITHTVSGKVVVVRTQTDRLLVQTVEPILVDAAQYAMTEGFLTLQEIAKLFKIPTVIPVSFSLRFIRG